MIEFINVKKKYKQGAIALNGISFNIKKGEFVFVTGESGSGKSTLIKLLLKESDPSGGFIKVGGYRLDKIKKKQILNYRRKIGCIFQDFRLLPDRNVYENVAFAQMVIGVPKNRIKRNVTKVLKLVGLSEKYKSYPNQLSGGEQQRVAIARALVNNPDIILADEPTGNLDPQMSMEIMKLLERANKVGTTVVVVTHDASIITKMRKRVIRLHKGTLIRKIENGEYKVAV